MRKLSAEELRLTARFFSNEIGRLATRPIRIMEVCGSHTVAIFKTGIRQLLPEHVELVSGPGCPVCVTPNDYLDRAVAYSRRQDVIITTFGDMLRVPGSTSTLQLEKARGADIRIVYSPLESLEVAKANADKRIVFLAVGFETTAPTAAATILAAEQARIDNFFVLASHKLVPPALQALLEDGTTRIDGFLLPGHVSAVIGEQPYQFLISDYQTPAVIGGFEALEILQAIYHLVKQLHEGTSQLGNQYRHIVRPDGNRVARTVLDKVYCIVDSNWRGIGMIPHSGLAVNDGYRHFDALHTLSVEAEPLQEHRGCRCGEVLKGSIKPGECGMFGTFCTPEHPVGACMVSVEGTCAAWYKYGAGRFQL